MSAMRNELQRYRDEIRKIEFYAPLDHGNGDYVVRVVQKINTPDLFGGNKQSKRVLLSYRAPNRIQAALVEYRIRKAIETDLELSRLKKAEIERTKEPQTTEELYSEVGDEALYEFIQRATDKTELSDEARKAVLKALADELKVRGWSRHMVMRKHPDIIGSEFSDPADVYTSYVSGLAGFVSKMKAAQDFMGIMKDIPKNQPNSHAYARQWVKDVLRNSTALDRISGKVRGTAFFYYLAGTLKAPAVNMTQMGVTIVPEMAKKVGVARAHAIVGKALKDVAFTSDMSFTKTSRRTFRKKNGVFCMRPSTQGSTRLSL
jgi:hypothetical protein